MKINHHPLFNTKKVEQLYTEKDGVLVKYVCTTATQEGGTFAADVFYRETPHPVFGNYYFGIYSNPYAGNAQVMICNADSIEKLSFSMIAGADGLEYSQHRHDYREVGDNFIDGGRAYTRTSLDHGYTTKKVMNGEFVEENV